MNTVLMPDFLRERRLVNDKIQTFQTALQNFCNILIGSFEYCTAKPWLDDETTHTVVTKQQVIYSFAIHMQVVF
jgi:hypothetical protein